MRLIGFTLVVFVLMAGCALADNLTPTDDAFVESTYPDNNFGNNVNLGVGVIASLTDISFLKFDLTDYASIISASLYLYKKTGTGTVSVTAYSTSTDWNETGLTWNNKPAISGVSAITSTGSANTWYAWNVTSFAQAAAGDQLSLAMTSGGYRVFHSSEGTFSPYLSVNGTLVPEPLSCALFALGAVTLAMRRKRGKAMELRK